MYYTAVNRKQLFPTPNAVIVSFYVMNKRTSSFIQGVQ